MSCIRNGNTYKRHNVKDGKCTGCGAIRVSDEERKAIIEAFAKEMIERANG